MLSARRSLGSVSLAAVLLVAALGCDGEEELPDGSVADGSVSDGGAADADTDAGVSVCAQNRDCDDDVFCNGVEQCMPGADGADAQGCVAGSPPCAMGTVCDEEAGACEACTPENQDADGDTSIAVACGGDDCDDTNGAINPGATEICDPLGVDEDCVPSTWGPPGPEGIGGDADGDRFVSAMCCQVTDDGLMCGDDCADDNALVNPDASEICNGIDDDCDGALDPVLEDRDADGWAGCADLPDEMRDCDETSPLTYPGAPERCDGEDNNCDGSAAGEDLDDDDHLATDVVCEGGPRAALPRTDCDDTRDDVSPAATEICDTVDHDCDVDVDEGPAVDSCTDDGVTTWACNAGTCEVASCAATHDDCNMTDPDGCEQPLSVRTHCGSCGNTCQWSCEAGPACDDPEAVSMGAFHACAITTSGRVRCWGRNDFGQLGTGSAGAPLTVPGPYVRRRLSSGVLTELTGVTRVESGDFYSCALAGGSIYCWGANDFGQLGTGSATAPSSSAMRVAPPSASTVPGGLVSDIAAGPRHACAIVGDFIDCWGDNRRGQVANSAPLSIVGPRLRWGGGRAAQIAAGEEHTCWLLSSDGTLWCAGDHSEGQLGNGPITSAPVANPRQVRNETGSSFLLEYDELSAGRNYTCAHRGSGARIRCWGGGHELPSTPVNGSGSGVSGNITGSDRSHALVYGNMLFGASGYHAITPTSAGFGVSPLGSLVDPCLGCGIPDLSASFGTSAESATSYCIGNNSGVRCLGAIANGEAGSGGTAVVSSPELVLPPAGS